MRVLAFRHIPFEGAGLIGPALAARGISLEYADLYQPGAALPDTAGFDGLIFMGGPMSVNDPLPYLQWEMGAIVQAMERHQPVLYLAYCDCYRKGSGEKMQIVAAFTGGDSDNLMVGRNGIFYDRKGRDWDVTITKIIDNPISVRQAFFAPYKKLVRMIEEQVAKRAAAADAASDAQLAATAQAAASGQPAPAAAQDHRLRAVRGRRSCRRAFRSCVSEDQQSMQAHRAIAVAEISSPAETTPHAGTCRRAPRNRRRRCDPLAFH